LKVRSMFEDYGNGVLNDGNLVEAIDIINDSRTMSAQTPKSVDKKALDKKEIKANKAYNEDIEVAKFVCEELDKFDSAEFKYSVTESKKIYGEGLNGVLMLNAENVAAEIAAAKAMPKSTDDEKAIRKAAIEMAKNKLSAVKAVKKYYSDVQKLVQPSYKKLEESFEREDKLSAELKALNNKIADMKKSDKGDVNTSKAKAAKLKVEFNNAKKETKALQDEFANFNRAAKPYNEAKKLLTQSENYQKLDEISAIYEAAKVRHEAAVAKAAEEAARKDAEEKAYREKLKLEKAAAKAAKKNK
ncbi:MAG: hypothetical protein J6J45_07120, partial [Clostridia bacterium]|nr:hypothetical protein [Clostridia bacterium]